MAADSLTHAERVSAAVAGQDVDRVPVSMWRHFFEDEQTSEGLVQATLAFQRKFDWDFVKVNPRASYHCEDWGVRTKYAGNKAPEVIERPIRVPADWGRIEKLSALEGVLGEHLTALSSIIRSVDKAAPVIMTVFTPVSICGRMAASEEAFLADLRNNSELVRSALEAVTETFSGFCQQVLERGASGIFFATTAWATTDRLSAQEYLEEAAPYDLKVLQSVKDAPFNVLHVCRRKNLLRELSAYPVHAFNWDSFAEGNPSLIEGRKLLRGKCVLGGVPGGDRLKAGMPGEIELGIRKQMKQMGNRGWGLAGSCTYDPSTPEEVVWAVRNALVEKRGTK